METIINRVYDKEIKKTFIIELSHNGVVVEIDVTTREDDTPNIWTIEEVVFITGGLTSTEKKEIKEWLYDHPEAWCE